MRAFLFAAALALGGCYVQAEPGPTYRTRATTDVYYVSEPPPEPRVEVRTHSPGSGYLWIDGYWDWRNNAWSNPQSTGDVATPGRGAQNPRPAAGSKQRLPEGIRVVLTMAPGSGLNGSITRDFVLRTRSE